MERSTISGPHAPVWARWRRERLLALRFCDLGLEIEGSVLEERTRRIEAELAAKGLAFRPHYWLSSDWFTPDGVPGIAIPFYLAHPRLTKLEEEFMFEAEGGTQRWCMKILRHEVGHAIDNAYRLHRKRSWRLAFGKASAPYPEEYQPRPYSKRFVLHLDNWYAQSHPTEDFAETFAVWLTPGGNLRKQYAGWPALKKIDCVDNLMKSIAGKPPIVSNRNVVEPLSELRMTLREYYDDKMARYGTERPQFYDRDLRRLFSDLPEVQQNALAATFLKRVGPQLRRLVSRWTGEYQYTIDQALEEMIDRCEELKLRLDRPAEQAYLEAAIMLTVQTMNNLHSGRHRLAL